MEYLILLVSLVWVGRLLAPNQAWRPREQLETAAEPGDSLLSDTTVLIPARNEAMVIERTLRRRCDILITRGSGLRAPNAIPELPSRAAQQELRPTGGVSVDGVARASLPASRIPDEEPGTA
ncbi:MAG: hypothetical protein WB586_22905 [Chthoniobacterales bacterium]